MFAGTHTALVTPFRNDRFDEAAFTSLIEAQIAGGITGIVPVGTTGESPTLDHTEHLRVIELAVQVAKKRTLVIAGTGSNSTREAVEMMVESEKLGADAVGGSPEEFEALISRELKIWADVVRQAGVKVE